MWKTINLKTLQSSEFWSLLPEGFKSTIVEDRPTMPLWRARVPVPNLEINIENKLITTKDKIDISSIEYIYNYTIKKWIYLKDRPVNDEFAGTFIENNTVLKINNSNYTIGDKLSSAFYKDVNSDDPMVNGNMSYGDTPPEWFQPIVTLDLKQINDKKTYDGSFPITLSEIRSIASIVKNNPEAVVVWARITDLIDVPMKKENNTIDNSELEKIKKENEKLNNKLVEIINVINK